MKRTLTGHVASSRTKRGERGQTILLVAVSIVALLSMAALAIDVVTLYVAKSEIQRAADAAALAGAKAIVDSGITTLLPTDPAAPTVLTTAQSMANGAISAIVQQYNTVAGAQPSSPTVSIVFRDPTGNNLTNDAIVTVTLQRPNLPAFFSRLMGTQALSTTATATAEAYNPANLSPSTPIQEQCVKPWLVANCDPNSASTPSGCTQPIVTKATGEVEDLISQNFYINGDCNPARTQCFLIDDPPRTPGANLNTVEYVPAETETVSIPPACGPGNAYAESIAGCDPTPYTCGGNVASVNWSPTVNPIRGRLAGDTGQGTQCLVSPGDALTYPNPWYDTPPQLRAGSGSLNGQLVSTSNQIVTIPIIDPCVGCFPTHPNPETVVGFLQAFVIGVGPNPGAGLTGARYAADVHIKVMNIVGCSTTSNGNTAVIGGNGASTIPVRLITPP